MPPASRSEWRFRADEIFAPGFAELLAGDAALVRHVFVKCVPASVGHRRKHNRQEHGRDHQDQNAAA